MHTPRHAKHTAKRIHNQRGTPSPIQAQAKYLRSNITKLLFDTVVHLFGTKWDHAMLKAANSLNPRTPHLLLQIIKATSGGKGTNAHALYMPMRGCHKLKRV